MAKSSRSNMGLGIAGARASASAKGNRGSIMQNYSRPLAGVLSVVVVAAALAVQPAAAREVVAFKEVSAGSIIIKTNERRLYYVLGNGHAVRYPVGVGKAGK